MRRLHFALPANSSRKSDREKELYASRSHTMNCLRLSAARSPRAWPRSFFLTLSCTTHQLLVRDQFRPPTQIPWPGSHCSCHSANDAHRVQLLSCACLGSPQPRYSASQRRAMIFRVQCHSRYHGHETGANSLQGRVCCYSAVTKQTSRRQNLTRSSSATSRASIMSLLLPPPIAGIFAGLHTTSLVTRRHQQIP